MPPDSPRVRETSEWFLKASRDLLAAEVLLKAVPPLLGEAAFHCQQCAEKAMKGYLAWHDIPFPRTHDLALIGGLCTGHDRDLETVCRTAEPLSVFAWVFRYPGDPAEPTRPETGAAIETARTVFAALLARLPSECDPAKVNP